MEQTFISSLGELSGKVAIVTGGAAGIGLETSIYLSRRGARVYAASRNEEKSQRGIEDAKARFKGETLDIRFHKLDLSSMQAAADSAREFLGRESRLDIVVCNAGISMMTAKKLSTDGYDRQFATNHLGHFAFVDGLLDLVEKTATQHHDARIVLVSSNAHKAASKLDYEALTTAIESDGTKYSHLSGAFKRYGTSKLANIYHACELDRRFNARGVKDVYCNACHPGTAGGTGLGAGTDQTIVGPFLESIIRRLTMLFSNSTADCAKTQTYLAASPRIKKENVHGEYWKPNWSWTLKYRSCEKEKIGPLAADAEEQKKLYTISEKELEKSRVSVAPGSV